MYPHDFEGDMMRRVDDGAQMLRAALVERDDGKKLVALDGLMAQLGAWRDLLEMGGER